MTATQEPENHKGKNSPPKRKKDQEGGAGEALPPALAPLPEGASFAEEGGAPRIIKRAEAKRIWQENPLLLCHKPFTMRRLGFQEAPRLFMDVMELYAFTHPAKDCIPSPRGLARALGLSFDEEAAHARLLHVSARHMLAFLGSPACPRPSLTRALAEEMAEAGWVWGAWVLRALESAEGSRREGEDHVWAFLPKWEFRVDERSGAPKEKEEKDDESARSAEVFKEEAAGHLRQILQGRVVREGQESYAKEVADIFLSNQEHAPRAVLAEAGTGIGKTLGYLAPAHLWAQRHQRPVWIATYTKALQRQIDRETERLYPDNAERKRRVVLRKGRDNYLCLLKWERLRQTAPQEEKIFLNLVARWIVETRDGDIRGGDFPAWLPLLAERGGSVGALTDRRGECLHHACQRYRQCFIERQRVAASRADLVVTNHALIMSRAASELRAEDFSGGDFVSEPRQEAERIIFDEAHHLFEAADSAFTMALTLNEMRETALWLEGSNPRGAARPNPMGGLQKRLSAWGQHDDALGESLKRLRRAAKSLPKEGAMRRLREGTPSGAAEKFFAAIRLQILQESDDSPLYSLETSPAPLYEEAAESAAALARALQELQDPLRDIAQWLETLRQKNRMTPSLEDAKENDRALETIARNLTSRFDEIGRWRKMLETLPAPPSDFVDRFILVRGGGVERDCGMTRHPLDPTKIFARAVLETLEGVLVTSASLRDSAVFEEDLLSQEEGYFGDEFGDEFADEFPRQSASESASGWEGAEMRTGFGHLAEPPRRSFTPSPFNYEENTRIFLVADAERNDDKARAEHYRDLFLAAGGGGLGLFTAIQRLRAAHKHLAPMLAEKDMLLLAQHIDQMDNGALVDLFRDNERSCLLGTDALRDGIDVPGEALRIIIFDKVPWPRPDILHRARAEHFGGRRFTDMLTRLRLQQAFGRLIRSEKDRGVFVLLEGRVPQRLLSAFPKDVKIERVSLSQAAQKIKNFF